MDSFIFQTAPCPTKRPSLETTVPDVSILMNVPSSNTYKCWKNNFSHKDENKTNSSILKKQVRFNSPNNNLYSKNQQVLITNKGGIDIENQQQRENCTTKANTCGLETPPLNKFLGNKQFEQIYMANIPNRHLDLSIISNPSKTSSNIQRANKTGENPNLNQDNLSIKSDDAQIKTMLPTTYKEFLKMQQQKENADPETATSIKSVTDIFNYNSPRRTNVNIAQNANKEEKNIERNQSLEFIHQNSNQNMENMFDRRIVQEKLTHQAFETSRSEQNINSNNFNRINERMVDGVNCHVVSQPKEVEEKAVSTSFHKSEDPTVKDLLKIIQQQNEQLLILQRQVASLLESHNGQKQIEAPVKTNNCRGVARQGQLSAGSTPRKAPLPTFSIDMMTSFEVSFRPQQNLFHKRQKEFISNEPKIQEITENESNLLDFNKGIESKIVDSSIILQEPINVQETCPSPEPSINIDMKEYESSDDEIDDMTSQIGATFYKNLMNQVNKIIQNANGQNNSDDRFLRTDELRERTFCAVKDATVKHLRKIGMNFPTIEEVENSNCSQMKDDPHMEQISFAVKQLLLKYLPDDQLAKLKTENNQCIPTKHKKDEKIVLNSRAPEFSFATLQFMRKYNLIAGEDGRAEQRVSPVKSDTIPKTRRKLDNNPKILDITALKQQPKLL